MQLFLLLEPDVFLDHFAVQPELEKVREALLKSEERYDAAEKRALLEIDRERTASAKYQKELAQLRQTHHETTDCYRVDIANIQDDLAETKQSVGVAEGMLREMRAMNQQQAEQLQVLRAKTAEHDTQNALLKHELETCRGKAILLEKELQQLGARKSTRVGAIKPRRSRKNLNE